MSREARAGLLVAFSLLVLFAGFYFLKGADLLSRQYEYHVFYDNVAGLQPSTPVQIRGLNVGKVKEISLNKNQLQGKIEVVFGVNRDTRLPVGTVAKLASLDLLGNKAIALDLGTSPDLIENGATLPGTMESGLVDKISEEATPLLHDVRRVVNSVDSVLNSVNMIFSPETRDDLQKSVAALHSSLDNLSSLSKSLESQRMALNRVIQNADKITTQLANANIDGTLTNFNKASEKIANAPIDQTLQHLDEMANSLNDILRKINSNEGSLGLLVHDKELYQNLTRTVDELGKLSADLKSHPSRYINLTIFGRKAQPASN